VRVFDYSSYRTYLRDYLENKRRERKSFSYGVWARQLGLKSPSTLIMILNGQRNPGPNLIDELVRHFDFKNADEKYFRDLVKLDKVRSDVQQSLEILKGLQERNPRRGFKILDHQTFLSISNWYYYAIREIVGLKNFVEDDKWIAEKLRFGIGVRQVREAIETMTTLGLLRRDTNGKLISTYDHVDTPTDLKDEGLKRYHEQILDNAKASIRSVDPADREISGVTFAMDRESVLKAKEAIRRFQVELCELLEKKSGEAVYHLEIAFLPLTEFDKAETETEPALNSTEVKKDSTDAVH
jgi:uncharacterized protein (TIGR02147 family)